MARKNGDAGRGMEKEADRRRLDRRLARPDRKVSQAAPLLVRKAKKPATPAGQGMEAEARRRPLDRRLRKKD